MSTVAELLAAIDAALAETGGRSLLDAEWVRNLLLDLRSLAVAE